MTARKISPFGRNDNAELERLDDEALVSLVKERANQPTIRVSVEDLSWPDDAGGEYGLETREMRGEFRVGTDPLGRVRREAVTRQDQTGADLLARILKHRDSITGQKLRSRQTKAETDTPANDALPRLPRGWVWARLGEIADIKGGITKDQKRNSDNCEVLPYLRVANVQRGYLDLSEIKEIPVPQEDVESLLLKPGDVLFNEGGDRDKLGRGWVWNGQIQRCVFQNHVFRARFHLPGSMEPKFISWYANTFGQDYFMVKGKQTTNLASINKTMLSAFPVPVAPLDQQKSIVAEIEKQFSRLDEAVANLKRVKANLKRYKAAVLKAAVEGRLVETEAELARREGRSYETGERLLQRILETRRSQWQGKGKYKEPAAPGTTDLPVLPEGWVWASPEQLSAGEPYSLAIGPFGSSLKVSDYTNAGVPLVFVRNIRAASFGGADTVFVTENKAEELRAHRVDAGDLLVTKMGDPPGDVCIYPTQRPVAIITADCIKLRIANGLSTQLLAYSIESDHVHKQILGITKGVAQLKVSLGRFSSIGLPLPPLSEQHRIVAEVDRRLSFLRDTESQVAANLQRAGRLRQSILSRSFSGELIPAEYPATSTDWPMAAEPAGQYAGARIKPGQRGH